MCSTPLPRGAHSCFACGFSGEHGAASSVWIDPARPAYQNVMPFHTGEIPGPIQAPRPSRRSNPETPLPPRPPVKHPTTGSLRQGSAQVPHAASDASEQQAPPLWQYETPSYIAAGSLPMLSLLSDETPTHPMKSRVTRRLSSIEEIDTHPARQQGFHEQPTAGIVPLSTPRALELRGSVAPTVVPIEERDTVPPGRALVPASPIDLDAPASWTAGQGADSRYAQLIASPARLRRAFSFNALDTMRWWLLRPGRIEFILWLGGTVLLVAVTCAFLLVSAFSFQWLGSPGLSGISYDNGSAPGAGNGNRASGPLPQLVLEEKGTLTPGQMIHLRGSSFSHDSKVTFTLDGKEALLDAHGRPAQILTDAQGSFSCTLWLSVGQGWTAGPHYIFARDGATRKIATLVLVLASSSGGVTISTSTPAAGSTPGASHTPVSTPVSGGTPVNQTPVPQTPTPPTTPTPTHTPTTTPTPGTSPTITPTSGTTPTVTVTPATPTASPGVAMHTSSTLSNAISSNNDASFSARLASVNPLVWVMVACYLCSMMLLGLAGVMHKRRRSY